MLSLQKLQDDLQPERGKMDGPAAVSIITWSLFKVHPRGAIEGSPQDQAIRTCFEW